jgi:hypothetical protein
MAIYPPPLLFVFLDHKKVLEMIRSIELDQDRSQLIQDVIEESKKFKKHALIGLLEKHAKQMKH